MVGDKIHQDGDARISSLIVKNHQTCHKFVISEGLVMLTQQEMSALEFSRKDGRIAALLELVEKIDDLKSLNDLAEWDQNTLLPDGAGGTRGNQMATIQGVLHDYRTNPRLGHLLDELQERVKGAEYTDADRGLVYEERRMYKQASK